MTTRYSVTNMKIVHDMNGSGIPMLDVTAPVGELEILIRSDGKVIWINTIEGCIFRACQVEAVTINDARLRHTKKEGE